MKAIEFFSGIGAFAEAARDFDLEIVAAFDQNQAANAVYASNFGMLPCERNLDTVRLSDIPRADLWWMSPPCTPYSVRGKRRDLDDPRAASLINLLTLCEKQLPDYVLIENVLGFKSSAAEELLKFRLSRHHYAFVSRELSPTQFGVPMKRPRYFVIASRISPALEALSSESERADQLSPEMVSLADFLFESDETLLMPPHLVTKYEQGFNIVDPRDPCAQLICFTKNYARCMRASGSLIASEAGVRRVSPEEILKLLGFSPRFTFPATIARDLRWRLVGNSVDVRAIRFLLQSIGISRL